MISTNSHYNIAASRTSYGININLENDKVSV